MRTAPGRSSVAIVLRVTSGNCLESFDFFLFGSCVTHISHCDSAITLRTRGTVA